MCLLLNTFLLFSPVFLSQESLGIHDICRKAEGVHGQRKFGTPELK